jgi:hypothetical protein
MYATPVRLIDNNLSRLVSITTRSIKKEIEDQSKSFCGGFKFKCLFKKFVRMTNPKYNL